MRLNDRPPRARLPREYVLAAQIKGKLATQAPSSTPATPPKAAGGGDDAPAKAEAAPAPAAPEAKEVNVIFVADLDLISDQMFALRQQAQQETLKFDNVPFILNCVDLLAGDEGFLELRKKRPKRRTLDTLELLSNQSVRDEQTKIEEAQGPPRRRLPRRRRN